VHAIPKICQQQMHADGVGSVGLPLPVYFPTTRQGAAKNSYTHHGKGRQPMAWSSKKLSSWMEVLRNTVLGILPCCSVSSSCLPSVISHLLVDSDARDGIRAAIADSRSSSSSSNTMWVSMLGFQISSAKSNTYHVCWSYYSTSALC